MTASIHIEDNHSFEHQAYQTIKERLLSGKLGVDKLYSENLLSKALGISRTPVRYALKQLEAEGFIQYQKNRGVTVKTVPLREMIEILGISILFQKAAVAHVKAGYATFSFNELDQLADGAQTLRNNQSYLDYLKKILQIYNTIISAAHNQTMLAMHQLNWERLIVASITNGYRQGNIVVPAKKQTTIGQIKDIIEYLRNDHYADAVNAYDELLVYSTCQISYYSFL